MKIINNEIEKVIENINSGVEAIVYLENDGLKSKEIGENETLTVQGDILTGDMWQISVSCIVETFSLTGKNTRYNIQLGW